MTTTGRPHETLISELNVAATSGRCPFCYLVQPSIVGLNAPLPAAIDALASSDGSEAVDALKNALYQRDWKAPFGARRIRIAAAAALRRIGSPPALERCVSATERGPRSVRSAARAALAEAD